MKEDMIVKGRYKDSPENEWFDVLLTDDQRMYMKDTGEEIKRTDMVFKPIDDDSNEVIDMEEEWIKYKQKKLKNVLDSLRRYLIEQWKDYNQDIYPKFRFNGRYFIPVFES